MTRLKYPLVCFDLDGTLVDDTVYIWKTLHDTFGTDAALRERARRDFFQGAISYREWFEHDLVLLSRAGANRARILEVLNGLKPMNGALELLSALKARGHILCLISGSLDIVVDHLFDRSLFDHVLINTLCFDEAGAIAGGEPTPYDLDGKADGLRELARREGLAMAETVYIGDNENDVWVAKAAGLSIAFNCKSDALRQVCHEEVTIKDLRGVSPLIS
jgi:phosphoserine phosphatase